jgi:hypothetical protein
VSNVCPALRGAAELLGRVLVDPMLTGIPFIDMHGALRAGQMVEAGPEAGVPFAPHISAVVAAAAAAAVP